MGETVYMKGSGYANGLVEHGSEVLKSVDQLGGSFGSIPRLWHLETSNKEFPKTSDSETILPMTFFQGSFSKRGVSECEENLDLQAITLGQQILLMESHHVRRKLWEELSQ